MALVTKGLVLQQLNRADDALATYDEVVRRFDEHETPILVQEATIALLHKGATLAGLNRQPDSLAAYDEVVRRFGDSEIPVLQWPVQEALLRKAEIELDCRLYESAARNSHSRIGSASIDTAGKASAGLPDPVRGRTLRAVTGPRVSLTSRRRSHFCRSSTPFLETALPH